MTFIPIYRKSHHLNVHLTTDDHAIHALVDEILNEISTIKEIKNKPKSREALKKVILNLIHTDRVGDRLRIPRDKNRFCQGRLYNMLWFKHEHLIKVAVDGLMELGYVDYLNGCWDKNKRKGFQSKIWPSDKFRGKLFDNTFACSKTCIQRDEPQQVIQLKDDKKKLTKYIGERSVVKMRTRLEQYNDFIRDQYITVNLIEPVMADNEFWINNLLKGLLNGKYGIDSLTLNQDIGSVNAGVENRTNPRYISHPSSVSSSHPSTYTSTSSILYPTTGTSTLISHIQTLIHLFSTQENSSNRLVDKGLMISEQQLCEYFLSWLLFMSKDIRIGKDDKGIKRAFRSRSTIGKMGMAELNLRLKYEALHRVFNMSSFKKGGRFYGASHLDIPSHMRGFININGEPVVELDYDALHVAMLYHLRGIDIDLKQDPYEMIVGPEDRTIKKIALLTAINAPSDEKAVGGIRKKLVKQWYKGEILLDKSLKSLLERAKLAHPDISDDIASGKGRMLQNKDSIIADAILTNLMTEKIPALPVHDSFVVPEQYEDFLRQQMEDEYEKVMKFRPGVSKKKKRFTPKKWEK